MVARAFATTTVDVTTGSLGLAMRVLTHDPVGIRFNS